MNTDVDVPVETEVSFALIVAIGTLCCCATMFCVALCIKCATWTFGHRGVRRLVHHVRGHSVTVDDHDADIVAARPHVGYISLDHKVDENAVHPSELELRTLDNVEDVEKDLGRTRHISSKDEEPELKSEYVLASDDDLETSHGQLERRERKTEDDKELGSGGLGG